jgi:predicted  nucleic acid-binding Zn-ribbon protein
VRLKKARRCLADARNGLQAVRDEELAPKEWIVATEREIESIRQDVQGKIDEIRASLREFEDQAGWY